MVRLLLENGADAHIEHDQELRWVAVSGRLELIRLLLDEGASVQALYWINEALYWTSRRGHLKVVQLLLTNVHARDASALRLAAGGGHEEVVRVLFGKGADTYARDDVALRWAATEGHVEFVQLLYENDADDDPKDGEALGSAAH